MLRFGEMGLDFFKYLESLTAAAPAPVRSPSLHPDRRARAQGATGYVVDAVDHGRARIRGQYLSLIHI